MFNIFRKKSGIVLNESQPFVYVVSGSTVLCFPRRGITIPQTYCKSYGGASYIFCFTRTRSPFNIGAEKGEIPIYTVLAYKSFLLMTLP